MRLPLITAPLPVISVGSFFVHGLSGSGERMVAKILTTEFSIALEGVVVGEKEMLAAASALGGGDTGEVAG